MKTGPLVICLPLTVLDSCYIGGDALGDGAETFLIRGWDRFEFMGWCSLRRDSLADCQLGKAFRL
jgi:hypothetical protein